MNPFKFITDYIEKKDEERIHQLFTGGFEKVAFPIVIIDGKDLNVVRSLHEFAVDSDWYYHEFDERMEFIDGNALLWSWEYDNVKKLNLPGSVIKPLTINDVKVIFQNYFNNTNLKEEVTVQLEKVATVEELINVVADKL